jgi:sigma-54 specific flagellar transcriptional regulator A
VRIVAATHRNLEESILKGIFREDLYYRINVFPIEMPPLRERLEDLPMLIEDLTVAQERNGHGGVKLSADAVHVLRAYHWPGNVRELSNLIERLAVLYPSQPVSAADLPARYRGSAVTAAAHGVDAVLEEDDYVAPAIVACMLPAQAPAQLPPTGLDLKEFIESIEIGLIRQALEQSGGVVAHAAKLLNTRRTTLVEKLRKYGLHRDFAERESVKA